MPAPYRQHLKSSIRLPFTKGLLLFVLPLPMLSGAMSALSVSTVGNALTGLIGFGLLMTAAYVVRRGLHAEAVRKQRKWATVAKVPWKSLGAALAGIGTGLGAWSLTIHGPLTAVALGIGALIGVMFTYGLDSAYSGRNRRAEFGVHADGISVMLEEAERKIVDIETAAREIRNPELRQRLRRIAANTREILTVLEDDPRDLGRARKFLKVYLEGTRRVTEGYASTHKLHQDETLEQNFRNVLITIEHTIEEQKAKLLENDLWDLDIQIEVLENQLKREGV